MARKPYVLKIVDKTGTPYCTIDDAELGNISWAITALGALDFTIPLRHQYAGEVKAASREVQVWRGEDMIWWGVIARSRSAGEGKITWTAYTLDWYFGRRVVGPVPRVGHLSQPRFEQGWEASWTPSKLPGSVPDALPLASTSTVQKIEGGQSLMLSPSGGRAKVTYQTQDMFTTGQGSTLTATGQSDIQTVVNATFGTDPRITVNVYFSNELDWQTAQQITEARANAIETYILTLKPGARVYAQGLGEKDPIASNKTAAGRQQNRRATFIYRDSNAQVGHKQYLSQKVTLRNPVSSKKRLKATLRAWVFIEDFAGPAANQWGLVLERQNPRQSYNKGPRNGMYKVVQRAVVPITKNSPMNRWIRMDASVYLPPDGKDYQLEAMLFPPNGVSYWDEVNLYTDDALRFTDDEESEIIQALVDHAQDPAMGKSDLNIDTDIRKTGVKRTREYRFADRENILDLLREFPTLYQGAEWDIQVTPTTRTFTTYYPRKSMDRGYVLKYGDNIYDFELDNDSDQVADSIVVMKEGDNASREERSVTDASLLDGLILEKAFDATPGSSVSSLMAQARRGIERYRDQVIIPAVMTDPTRLDELLDNVFLGDVVHVDIKKGALDATGKYRVVTMTLEPNTDHMAYEITPEDDPLTLILDWRQPGWSYFHQDQTISTGDNNTTPVETNPEYALPETDVSSWGTGTSPFGWKHDGSGVKTLPDNPPATLIPVKHEVWIRRTVQCTEEMYVSVALDAFAYIYVNGNLLTGNYLTGLNFRGRGARGPIRVPSEFLDPSGNQVIALHVQDKLASYGGTNITDFLIADMKVIGLYIPEHVVTP